MSAKRFLRKIKQVFGLSGGGTDTERPGERRTDVTVERETDASATTAETPESATEPDTDTAAPTVSEESVEERTDEEGTPAEDETEAKDETTESTPDGTGEPVENIKGIGPTYSDRLAAAGIETVPQLAAADPATVADAAQTGTTKAANWIDRAQARQ